MAALLTLAGAQGQDHEPHLLGHSVHAVCVYGGRNTVVMAIIGCEFNTEKQGMGLGTTKLNYLQNAWVNFFCSQLSPFSMCNCYVKNLGMDLHRNKGCLIPILPVFELNIFVAVKIVQSVVKNSMNLICELETIHNQDL